MIYKRLTALVLALVLVAVLCPVLPTNAAGTAVFNGVAYSDDVTTWRQTDPAWKNIKLGSSSNTMGNSGCLVTAVAIQMCRAGCYPPNQLNPGSLVTWLNQKGYFTSSGGLIYGNMTAATCPRFVFDGTASTSTDSGKVKDLAYACSTIQSLQQQGYSLIARVNSPTGRDTHFVAVCYLFGNDDVVICDPGSGYTRLSKYSEYRGFLCFKPNPSAKDTIFNGAAPVTSSTSPVGSTTTPSNGNGGTSAPASGKSTASNEVSNAVNVIVTYDPNWVSAGKTSQSMRAGSKYNLLTLSRDDAAFLGWYRDGNMVTNTCTVPYENHTLVARWDTRGFGFPIGTPYDGRFTDVSVSSWYFDSVSTIFAYGLMNGVTTSSFAPNDALPISHAITMAARVSKQYKENDITFETSKPWYLAPTAYAQEQGILTSLPLNFDAEISRQEFAVMLSKAIPKSVLPEVNIVDDGAICDVYKSDKEVYRLYRAGIFQGDDAQGKFRPNDSITRAEAAAVLVRVVNPNARTLFTLLK